MDDMIYLNYDAGELGEREATFYNDGEIVK
jgi:hypothetical protein